MGKRFTDNGNGTISDNVTGLMWVKSPDSTIRTWANAISYANNLSLGGYTDWRLPNANELESLVNVGEPDTAAWLNGQGFNNVQSEGYWSSSTYADYPDDAGYVDMWNGFICVFFKTFPLYVLPVRAGERKEETKNEI